MRGGLTGRTLVAGGLLALVVAATFAVLLVSVVDLRAAHLRARESDEVLVAANRLERLLVDLETGERGFLLTGHAEFLEPWQAARVAFPQQAEALERLVAGNPEQEARAEQITQAGMSYIRDYSVPLVDAARRDPTPTATVAVTEEGKRRVDAMRAEFDRFLATEHDLAVVRQQRSAADAARAIVAAAAGLTGSIVLIAAYSGYLTRAVVAPVRRAAVMAGRLAGGDLRARLPERGVGEIAVLQRSFNTMADALERGRDELAASRTRVVDASDQARRRIERDLHDGTQQRLVSLVLELRTAEAGVPSTLPELRTQLAGGVEALTGALDELRELSRGIHPAILSEGGLAPALKALARRSAVPVELDVDVPARLAERVEVAVYYVVSEALANATKYAGASVIRIEVRVDEGRLHLCVRDDGVGGADPARGSGLIGLTDRVQAVGGTISVTSPTGQGTTLLVDLPAPGR
ncbi:MAG TPA: CHASE3 domain-containing protein [Pilimelia sp.]|nr:CHASE3 domain-containing protein [Pilimelia sp.]